MNITFDLELRARKRREANLTNAIRSAVDASTRCTQMHTSFVLMQSSKVDAIQDDDCTRQPNAIPIR